MTNYKFKSEVTKKCVSYGVSNLSEVRREEISSLLFKMRETIPKIDWLYMFFVCRVDNETAWDEQSILFKLKDLRSDIDALKGKLKS